MSWYLSRRSQNNMAADLCPDAGLPKAALDDALDQIGLKLGVSGRPERIVVDLGCTNLKKRAMGR